MSFHGRTPHVTDVFKRLGRSPRNSVSRGLSPSRPFTRGLLAAPRRPPKVGGVTCAVTRMRSARGGSGRGRREAAAAPGAQLSFRGPRQRGVIDRHRPRPRGLRSGACTGWSDLLSGCRSGAPQAPARPAGHPAGVEKPLAPRERHRHASGAARPRAEHRALAPALRPAVARGEPR